MLACISLLIKCLLHSRYSKKEIDVSLYKNKERLILPLSYFNTLKLLLTCQADESKSLEMLIWTKNIEKAETNVQASTACLQTYAQMHTQKVQCLFLFLRHSSFFAWVHYPVRSWRSEDNVTPQGSHLSPFSPSSLIPPHYSVPAGISLFSSGEMSDLFHHLSHRSWTALYSTNICKAPQISLISRYQD